MSSEDHTMDVNYVQYFLFQYALRVPEMLKLLKMWGHLLVTRQCDLANMRSHWIPFPVLKSPLSYLTRLLNGENS